MCRMVMPGCLSIALLVLSTFSLVNALPIEPSTPSSQPPAPAIPDAPPKHATLYVLKESLDATYGCSPQRIEYLEKAVLEAGEKLVEDAHALLSDANQLRRSIAVTFLGDGNPSHIRQIFFERMRGPLSAAPKPIDQHLEVTAQTASHSVTFVCAGPHGNDIASNRDATSHIDRRLGWGHVISLQDPFFHLPTLEEVLELLRRGEISEATASMAIIHELSHNLAILGNYRLEDFFDRYGRKVYGPTMLQKVPAQDRWKTADAPPIFALYAHWWMKDHPAPQCAAEAPAPAEDSGQGAPGEVAGEPEGGPATRTRGGKRKGTHAEDDAPGPKRKQRGSGKTRTTAGTGVEVERRDGKVKGASTAKKHGQCEPQWPTIHWAKFAH